MAMIAGKQGEINITPLIDVLLVLLIIFMVILPEKSKGLGAQAPPPAPDSNGPPPPPREIVVSVKKDRSLEINTQPVAWDHLAERLKEILARRPDGIFFVAGAGSLDFEDVARVLDEARGVGIDHISLMPRSK